MEHVSHTTAALPECFVLCIESSDACLRVLGALQKLFPEIEKRVLTSLPDSLSLTELLLTDIEQQKLLEPLQKHPWIFLSRQATQRKPSHFVINMPVSDYPHADSLETLSSELFDAVVDIAFLRTEVHYAHEELLVNGVRLKSLQYGARLWRGQQSAVHAAKTENGESVVVKTWLRNASNAHFLLQEYEAEQRLQRFASGAVHAHQQEHAFALVRPFIKGEALDKRVQYATEELDYSACLCQAWNALLKAHACGVSHGDVKASNLLIDASALTPQAAWVDWEHASLALNNGCDAKFKAAARADIHDFGVLCEWFVQNQPTSDTLHQLMKAVEKRLMND